MPEPATNKPIQIFRRRGVKVSVFQNTSGDAVFHKVAIQRIYREEGGEWKTASALGRDDLPVARMLLARAWEYILDKESEPNSE